MNLNTWDFGFAENPGFNDRIEEGLFASLGGIKFGIVLCLCGVGAAKMFAESILLEQARRLESIFDPLFNNTKVIDPNNSWFHMGY